MYTDLVEQVLKLCQWCSCPRSFGLNNRAVSSITIIPTPLVTVIVGDIRYSLFI